MTRSSALSRPGDAERPAPTGEYSTQDVASLLGLSAEHFCDDVFWDLFVRGEALPYPGGRAALIEFHYEAWPRIVERRIFEMMVRGVRPVIVLNKADVALDLDQRLLDVESIAPAVPIVVLSALTGDHLADLSTHLMRGQTAVVLGSSGVGKSTLVNALLGQQRQATAAVREDDSRGRHTTTHRELFELPGGAFLIDTPGIRALEIGGADEGIETAFDDIAELAAACRFNDCRHQGEPGCAVRSAIDEGRLGRDRLASHQKLERELARAERKIDARAEAEYRKRWRNIHKQVSRQMREKYKEAL